MSSFLFLAFLTCPHWLEFFLLYVVNQLRREVFTTFTELESPDSGLVTLELPITQLAELKFENIRERPAEESPIYITVLAAGRVVQFLAYWTTKLNFAFSHLIVST